MRLMFSLLVQHVLEDIETARLIRRNLMSEFVRDAMRDYALGTIRERYHVQVTHEYVDFLPGQEDEEEIEYFYESEEGDDGENEGSGEEDVGDEGLADGSDGDWDDEGEGDVGDDDDDEDDVDEDGANK